MNILDNIVAPILVAVVFVAGVLIVGFRFKKYVKEVKLHNRKS
jgi:hypothetical protein